MIAGDIAGLPIRNGARYVGEAVPDALTPALLGDVALDLLVCRRRTDGEISSKADSASARDQAADIFNGL
jgi:hypothetical protein